MSPISNDLKKRKKLDISNRTIREKMINWTMLNWRTSVLQKTSSREWKSNLLRQENITYPICLISIIFRNSYKLVRKKEIMYWKNRRHNRTDASQKDIQMSSRHEKMYNSLVIRKKCKLNLSATRLPPHSAGWLQWRRQTVSRTGKHVKKQELIHCL